MRTWQLAASAVICAAPASAQAQTQIGGRWIVTLDYFGTPTIWMLTIEQDGKTIAGTLAGDTLTGAVEGDTVRFFAKDTVGGSEDVSKLSGLRTHRTIIGAHIVCSLTAVITGIFLASRLKAGTPTVGLDGGYDLESIAAVVLGGTALTGGRGGVIGTIGGVFILAVLDNTFNQLELNAFLKDVVRGIIIIAAVAVYARRQEKKA